MNEKFLDQHLARYSVNEEDVTSAGIAFINMMAGRDLVVTNERDGYGLVSGGVEEGESIIDCAVREWYEEAGSSYDSRGERWIGKSSVNTEDIHLPPLIMVNRSTQNAGIVFPFMVYDPSMQQPGTMMAHGMIDSDVHLVTTISLADFSIPQNIRKPHYSQAAFEWLRQLNFNYGKLSFFPYLAFLSYDPLRPPYQRLLNMAARKLYGRRIYNLMDTFYVEV